MTIAIELDNTVSVSFNGTTEDVTIYQWSEKECHVCIYGHKQVTPKLVETVPLSGVPQFLFERYGQIFYWARSGVA